MMKNNPLAALFLTATLSLLSGAALAADDASSNNGQANSAASAGQVAPDAHENLAPNGVDNGNINSGSSDTTLTPNSSSTHTQQTHTKQTHTKHMSKDEMHKNSMCKNGKCTDMNKKVQTGSDTDMDVNTKTDGTTQ